VPLDRETIERAMETARRAAEAGAQASLRHWRTGVAVDLKVDHTPVTAADRESEAAILGVIREAFPDHPILAEESGLVPGRRPESGSRWIVDPLDGTRGFSRGGTFWGPLVALEHEGTIVAGAAAVPALGDTYWAGRGLGSYRNGARLSVSAIADWREATLSVGELKVLLAGPTAPGVGALISGAASTRCYGDLSGCLMVLDGRAEAWLESGVKPWDVAALVVLVEEAGGRFTDFEGTPSLASGRAVATNGHLHGHVLGALLQPLHGVRQE
jgi:histidinol-phosphatase